MVLLGLYVVSGIHTDNSIDQLSQAFCAMGALGLGSLIWPTLVSCNIFLLENPTWGFP